MKTCIFIPAWNVREQVVDVLSRIPVSVCDSLAEVCVLDNASTDGTADAVREWQRQGTKLPLRIYRNRSNLGYGGSQKVAYAHAIRQGYDYVAMLHGDGQYPPEQLPALFALMEKSRAGMAYGSRLLELEEKDETPWLRRYGVRFLSSLQNLVSGMRLAEWYSGFRAFHCAALGAVPFEACDADYYFDVQIILLLTLGGFTIAELPVAKKYEGHTSPVNIYQFGRQVLARMLQYPLARARVWPRPLYRTSAWAELKKRVIPPPLPYTGQDAAATRAA
jgi:glycosyltransferase involved in cell wall biosynthesis